MIFSDLLKSGSRVLSDNAPAILTAFGVVGTCSTAVLAGKASYEAAGKIREATVDANVDLQPAERDVELTTVEKFQLVWPLYIPAATTGAVTCVAIILAHRVSSKRAAALAAAYALSEGRLEEYQEKVKEKFGLNKETEVRDELAQERVTRDLLHSDIEYHAEITGRVLMHDAYSGRFFWGDMETVRKAVNDINQEILRNDSATISDFYDMVGLSATSISDEFGWNSENLMNLSWTTCTTPEGSKPAHSFDFESRPVLRPWSQDSFR